jgi:cytoskeletal protein CcmA (bactofilin family)
MRRHAFCSIRDGWACLRPCLAGDDFTQGRKTMFERTDEHEQGRIAGTAMMDRLQDESALTTGDGTVEQEMTAHVGASTEFKGILRYEGTIRIDGKVEGEIHTEGVLLIGRTAVIRATVRARSIVSCGTIVGNVAATEKIALLEPAVLQGSVTTPLLSMETGVRFRGSLEVPEAGEESSSLHNVSVREVAEVANL